MKVSIITIVFNKVQEIEQTIQSVINQDYPDIEYILVDGASKDGTLAVIERYKRFLTKCISEPDSGIYEAINKGISLAAGDIMPSKSLSVFVKAGQTQEMDFRGPFGASYCHCYTQLLVGRSDVKAETITLIYSNFCDQ